MKIDLEKIYGKIKVHKISTQYIADFLGITRMSLYNKLNGKYEFKASEIEKLAQLLGKDIFLK